MAVMRGIGTQTGGGFFPGEQNAEKVKTLAAITSGNNFRNYLRAWCCRGLYR